MGVYFYHGVKTNRRKTDGVVAARTEKEAHEILATQAIQRAKLHYLFSMNGLEYKLLKPSKVTKLKKKDIAYMFKQMSFLIKAGVTTFEAIEVLSVSANVKIAKVGMMLKPMIIEGMSLADALNQVKLFPPDIVEKVRAGESSNSMEETLRNIAQKLDEELELISSVKGGLTYPIFSLTAVISIAMIMLIYLIPQIAEIVSEFGAELPALTKTLIAISNFVRAYWFIVLIGLVIAIFVHLKVMKRNIKYRRWVHKNIYKIPVAGKIALKLNLLYFCSALGQLMENGKNTANSIEMAKNTVKNRYLYETLQRVETNIVRKGFDLYSAMADYEIFPSEFLQMIMIGVRTGNVSDVLNSLYNQYRYEVKDEIKAATDLIQPISLILIGGITGVFVLGMYSAIYCLF